MGENENVAVAARKKDWGKARQLVGGGLNVNAVDGRSSTTALHYAVRSRNKEICLLLLGRGANISARDWTGDQPLHWAARGNCADICKLLVDHGADVTAVNFHGETPLLIAASFSSCDSLTAYLPLITNDSVNVADGDGNHALHIAGRKGHSVTVQLLVDCGADTSAANEHGQTPLHTAAGGEKDCPDLCEILLKRDARIDAVDKDGNQPLQLACKQSHTETMKLLVTYGADLNAVDAVGNQCLHLSCEAGQTSTVKALLDCNADVLATNDCIQTALHKVASSDRDCRDICLLLIAKGAQVNAADGNGDTPLQVACQKGNMKTAEVLQANGADCKVLNEYGETVLHLVCKRGVDSRGLCEKLISHGASPHTADREGSFPFHVALKNRLPKSFCLLFEQWGGSTLDDLQRVNISDIDIGHLLCVASWKHENATCGKLLKFGANACVTDADRPGWCSVPYETRGYQALHHAARVGDARLCQLLIDHNALVNVQMDRNCDNYHHMAQPLHLAVIEGHLDVCRLLIEKGACLGSTMSPRGRTALHLAIVDNKQGIVRLLLSHGAKPFEVKIGNVSALERSEVKGNMKVAALLQASDKYPDEIVSQGEAALHVYLSSCSEGTAVTVFLRVDVVGRDRAGKTSLTKSLTLQKFDPHELSTRGVVFDPKCQIIVEETCDWTIPLTSKYYRDLYDKNVTAIMAEALDTPEVKDQYFSSKEGQKPKRKRKGQKRSTKTQPGKSSSAKMVAIGHDATDSPVIEELDVAMVKDDSMSSDQQFIFGSGNRQGLHPGSDFGSFGSAMAFYPNNSDVNEFPSAASGKCETLSTIASSPCSRIPGPVSASVSHDSLLLQSQQCLLPCQSLSQTAAVISRTGSRDGPSFDMVWSPENLQPISESVKAIAPAPAITIPAIKNPLLLSADNALSDAGVSGELHVPRCSDHPDDACGCSILPTRSGLAGRDCLVPDQQELLGVPQLLSPSRQHLGRQSCIDAMTYTSVGENRPLHGQSLAGNQSSQEKVEMVKYSSTCPPRYPLSRQQGYSSRILSGNCTTFSSLLGNVTCSPVECMEGCPSPSEEKRRQHVILENLDPGSNVGAWKAPEVNGQFLGEDKGEKPKRRKQGEKQRQPIGRSVSKNILPLKGDGQQVDPRQGISISNGNVNPGQRLSLNARGASYAQLRSGHLDLNSGVNGYDNKLREKELPSEKGTLLAAKMETPDFPKPSAYLRTPQITPTVLPSSSISFSLLQAQAKTVKGIGSGQRLRRRTNRNKKTKSHIESPPSPTLKTATFRNGETGTDETAAIPQNIKDRVSGYLRDKDSHEKAKNEIVVTVLDYAGQHVFYATHHLCLSKAGFYFVVFDASQPLDATNPAVFRVSDGDIVCIPLFPNETNYDRVEEWMSAIHVMEPDLSRLSMLFEEHEIALPAMFLVGTHADKLREQPGMLEGQDEFMRKKLEGTVLAKHIIWASKDRMCFFVDNTMTDPDSGTVDPQVRLLRSKTEEVARKVAQHHKLPVPWLEFEQEVREVKDKTKKTASVEELLQLAMKTAGIKTKEELEVLLHYLSNRAVLLYHPMALTSGDEEVVLDVEWLIKKVEKVVTIQTDVPSKFKMDVKRSQDKGIMTTSLIRYLLSDSSAVQTLIISLMSRFHLLCEYALLDADRLKASDSQTCFIRLDQCPEPQVSDISIDCSAYFIPCLLTRASPLESEELPASWKTMPLLLHSPNIRIPQSLFYCLLTRLCKRFPHIPVLFSNVGYFHVYPNHKLELSLNKYSFQLSVLCPPGVTPLPAVCDHVRLYIVAEAEDAKKKDMPGLIVQLGYNDRGAASHSTIIEDEFVSLDGFPASQYVLMKKTGQAVNPALGLYQWYKDLQNSGTHPLVFSTAVDVSSAKPFGKVQLTSPVSGLLGHQPHECLVHLANLLDKDDVLGDDWRELWVKLTLRPLKEELVRRQFEGPTLFTLSAWCRAKSPSEATVGDLLKALGAIYRNDAAGLVERYVEVWCDTSNLNDGSQNGMESHPSLQPSVSYLKRQEKSLSQPLDSESLETRDLPDNGQDGPALGFEQSPHAADVVLDLVIVAAVPVELEAVKKVLLVAGCEKFEAVQIRNPSGKVVLGGTATSLRLFNEQTKKKSSTLEVLLFTLLEEGETGVRDCLQAIEYGIECNQVSKSSFVVMVGMCSGNPEEVSVGDIMAPCLISKVREKLDAAAETIEPEATSVSMSHDVRTAVHAALPDNYGYTWIEKYLPHEVKNTPSPRYLQDTILDLLRKATEGTNVSQLHKQISDSKEGWPTQNVISKPVIKEALAILKDTRGHVREDDRFFFISEQGKSYIEDVECESHFPLPDPQKPKVRYCPMISGDLDCVGMKPKQWKKLQDHVAQRKAGGFDMEGYGFLDYAGKFLKTTCNWFVQVVTDHATTESKMDYYQEYGSCLAAAFLLHVLEVNPSLAARERT